MSWITISTNFVQKLFQIGGRVEKNTKEIEAIRQDLKELTRHVNQLTSVVKRDQDKNALERENLVLRLQNEILKMEGRLERSHGFERNLPSGSSNGSSHNPNTLKPAEHDTRIS